MTNLPNEQVYAPMCASKDMGSIVAAGPFFVDVIKIQAIFKDDIFHMLLRADNATIRDAIEACEAMAQRFSDVKSS